MLIPILLLISSSLSASESSASRVLSRPGQTPGRIWLSKRHDINRGDNIKVYTRAEQDGYLVVLHADPEGRVRMLFPLDPSDDHFLRGDRDYEIVGRGKRSAFTVYENAGNGTVYAAFSRDPFQFGELVRNDHWDYGLDVWQAAEDAEPDLTALVDRMTNGTTFEYDFIRYDVGGYVANSSYYYDDYDPWYYRHSSSWHPRSRFNLFIGFGSYYPHRRYLYPVAYDPFCYDPYFCYGYPYYYDPYYTYYGYRHPTTVIINRPYYPVYTYYPERQGWRMTFKSPADRYGATAASVPTRRRTLETQASTGRRVTPAAASPASRVAPATRRVEPAITSPRPATPANRRPAGAATEGSTRVRETAPAADRPAVRATPGRRTVTSEPARGVESTRPVRESQPVRRDVPAQLERRRTTDTPTGLRETGEREETSARSAPIRSTPTRETTRSRPVESERRQSVSSPERSSEPARRPIAAPERSSSSTRARPSAPAQSAPRATSGPSRSAPSVRAAPPSRSSAGGVSSGGRRRG